MIAEIHYRNPMKYSDEKIEEAEKSLKSLKNAVRDLKAEINSFEEPIPTKMGEKDIEFLEMIFDLGESSWRLWTTISTLSWL